MDNATVFTSTNTGAPLVLFRSGFSPLSNFHPRSPFTYIGVNYCCGEQYYQASKATHFKDHEAWKKIMGTRKPREMKQIGYEIKGYDHEEWKKIAPGIAYEGIEQRFQQNKSALELLLKTNCAIIAEATEHDRFWATGIDINDEAVLNPMNWTGQNHMGKMLMQLRDEMKN